MPVYILPFQLLETCVPMGLSSETTAERKERK